MNIIIVILLSFLGLVVALTIGMLANRKNALTIGILANTKNQHDTHLGLDALLLSVPSPGTRSSFCLISHGPMMHNVSSYATYHNYDYHIISHRPKFQAIREQMQNQSYEYIVWIDKDFIIQFPSIPMDIITCGRTHKTLYIGKSPGHSNYCDAFFVVRNNNKGRRLVNACSNRYNTKTAEFILNKTIKTSRCSVNTIPSNILCHADAIDRDVMISRIWNRKQLQSLEKHRGGRTAIQRIAIHPRVAVLLTMFASPARFPMYAPRIQWWEEHSGLDIFIVDSSGSGLAQLKDHSRVFCFKQSQPEALNMPSATETESLQRALAHFAIQFASYDMVIKVTAKYIIPGLAEQCNTIDPCVDLILQHRTDTCGQNCEVFGARPFLFSKMLTNAADGMESNLAECMSIHPFQRMDPLALPVEWRVPRSHGDILTYL